MSRILIVESDQKIADRVEEYLQYDNFQTHRLTSGKRVASWVKEHKPSLIILDVDLPGQNGLSICREIKQFSHVPVIFATGCDSYNERLLGFESGADDYICKPYDVRELVARVKVILKRCSASIEESIGSMIDSNTLSICLNDERVVVSAIEFSIFELLYHSPGRIYSRQNIIDSAYQGCRVVSERTVDSHIKNLRKKLTVLRSKKDLIKSVYSVGYKFQVE